MATVSRGEITITNVNDGKPLYTHWAYAMDALGKDRFNTDGGDVVKWSSRILSNFTAETGVTINSWGDGVLTATTTTSTSRFYLGVAQPYGVPMTITAEVKADKAASIRIGPFNALPTTESTVGTDWTTISYVTTSPASASLSFYLRTSGVVYQVRNVTNVINYKYAGSYVDSIATDSEDPTKYTWQRILGDDGKDGEKGDKGDTGSKGDKGDTGSKGENGVSVTGTQVQYVQSSSMTEPTTGWSNTRPTPVPGQWLWTRSRNTFSDGTYGAWATVPTLIGREAIVISATAPSNPSTGTLWQTPTDPNVKQWDGANWIDWGIAPENIAADNLVVKDGRFDKLIGTELEGGIITNSFDYWNGEYVSGSNDQLWRRGQTIIEKSEITTMWEDYNKTTGVKIKEGGVVHNSDGVIVFVNDPANYNQRASYTTSGIRLADSRGLGDLTSSFLTYNDLVTVNVTGINAASGWERYAATGISAPTASRTARMVQLSGAFKPTNDIPGSADQVTMNSQLPLWARPKEEITLVQQGSGMNRYRLTITTDGYITMSRYGTTSYATAIKGAYLNISVAYAGADIF